MNKLYVMNVDVKLLARQINALSGKWNPVTKQDEAMKEGILNLLAEVSAQADGTVQNRLGIVSSWKCPKCKRKADSVPFDDVAGAGAPMCVDCEEDMELVSESIVFITGETQEVLYQC